MEKSLEIQNQYYAETASHYDDVHLGDENHEHNIALSFMSSIIETYQLKSILDVGAGTGRTIEFLRRVHPNVQIIGVEPVAELRKIGYQKAIPVSVLVEGNGNFLDFEDKSFDLVCEFGVLHHVPDPNKFISEMLRVSKKGIFISDTNNFGQGSLVGRSLKQFLNFLGLWRVFRYLKTAGKIYEISEGDGLYYSYSVFNNYQQIKLLCKKIYLLNTSEAGRNLYRTASHVALFGVKN